MSFFTSEDEPSWGSEDALWWASVLSSERGKQLLARLSYFRPPHLAPNPSSDLTAQHAQLVAGYETCIRELLLLKRPTDRKVESQPEAYPDLDDDSKWQKT